MLLFIVLPLVNINAIDNSPLITKKGAIILLNFAIIMKIIAQIIAGVFLPNISQNLFVINIKLAIKTNNIHKITKIRIIMFKIFEQSQWELNLKDLDDTYKNRISRSQ